CGHEGALRQGWQIGEPVHRGPPGRTSWTGMSRPARPGATLRSSPGSLAGAQVGDVLLGRRLDALLAEAVRGEDLLVLVRLAELDELLVEGVVKVLVLRAEGEAAIVAHRL